MRISKTQITVGSEPTPVVTYRSLADVREHGVDAAYKRDDYYIVPLGELLEKYREADKQALAAKGLGSTTSELLLVADADVPYRILFEVLYTAGQSEFGKYHLLGRSGQ